MIGGGLIIIGAAIWWLLTTKADDMNMGDDLQQFLAFAAYTTAGLGALFLMS